jgi:flagellar hook-basal body complex protein FliE
MPVDPTAALRVAAEWQVPGVEGVEGASPVGGAGSGAGRGFGSLLASLSDVQADASSAARDLAAGTATDVASAVTAIDRARLAMQMASQIRTKAVEATLDVFHTQV